MFVGIDVAKAELQVCAKGETEVQRSFANNTQGHAELVAWLHGLAGEVELVGLEATGTYGQAVCAYVYAQGLAVSLLNPAQIKAYAKSQLKRHKTDRIDAALIADFCRTQQPPHWTPPDTAQAELRELIRHLDDLKALRQAQLNRLEAHPTSPTVVRDLHAHVAFLEQQIAQLEHDIEDHLDQHPILRQQRDLLTSIPGIGKQTSHQILAELGDLRRFDNVRQIVALAGLNPQQRQSGSSLHRTAGISRMGRASLRAALYMPALCAMRHNPLLRAFAERLTQSGLHCKQVIVAVMRKLLHLAYGVLKHQQPFDPHYLALGA